MKRTTIVRGLLAGSALFIGTAALAQEPEPQPDQSDATADAAIAEAHDLDEAQAKIELLQAQVEALQESIAQIQAAQAKAAPSWKGAPELADKDSGFSFKPTALIQYDAGYTGFPDGNELNGTVGTINYNNLGFNTRARRLVIGAQGSLPGGFGYKAEFNLAQGTVDYEDIVLTYQPPESPFQVTIGNFYPLSSLETMTSSKVTSMLERASFTDAFNYNRRLGIGLALLDPKTDKYTLTAGIFSQPINNTSFTRTGWQVAVRGTYSPMLGDTRLHLGANFQYRANQRDQQQGLYRARPLTQLTDQRFVSTGAIASGSDYVAGLELGAIHKSLHAAAEVQKLWVNGYNPGHTFGDNNGTGGATFYNGDPSFWGGYFEMGYFLTGETRGYKGGKWDRTKVLKPFDKGGWGAIQLNGRLDYVDLSDRVDDASSSVAAPYYVNGGKQLGYQLSLIWSPMDYIRFMAQYGHVSVTGGPAAATVDPNSNDAVNNRKYGVDTAAVRAQLEF